MTEETVNSFLLNRRRFIAATAASGLAAAGVGEAKAAPATGGELKVAYGYDPATLDPISMQGGIGYIYLYLFYDSLVDWDYDTVQPLPGLAESWNYDDPLTLSMNLRKGVTFHDGTPFNAAAAKFNLERTFKDSRSNIKADLESVASVETDGDYRILIKLKRQDYSLPLVLGDRAGMMVSPKAAEQLGADMDRQPVGTGPWSFVEWRSQDRVVGKRNLSYWKKGLPYLDRVTFSVIPEPNTGLLSVLGGQNDIIFSLQPQQKAMVDRAPKLVPSIQQSMSIQQLYLNYGRKPLDDVRVRQALNYAIDRPTFAKVTSFGLDMPCWTLIPPKHWAYDPSLDNFYPYDPDKAKALLKEAGYPDGIDIGMMGRNPQREVQRQEVLVEQFRKAGIRVRFQVASNAESNTVFYGKEKRGAALLAQWSGRTDPSLTFSNLFAKDGFYNAGGVNLPGFDALLAATSASADIAVRKAAFAKIQRFVAEQALAVPLVVNVQFDAYSKRVNDYHANLLAKPRLEGVYVQ